MVGLLTERSARTLLYYLQETNLNVFYWLQAYMQAYPIPRARPALFLGMSFGCRWGPCPMPAEGAGGAQRRPFCGLEPGIIMQTLAPGCCSHMCTHSEQPRVSRMPHPCRAVHGALRVSRERRRPCSDPPAGRRDVCEDTHGARGQVNLCSLIRCQSACP